MKSDIIDLSGAEVAPRVEQSMEVKAGAGLDIDRVRNANNGGYE